MAVARGEYSSWREETEYCDALCYTQSISPPLRRGLQTMYKCERSVLRHGQVPPRSTMSFSSNIDARLKGYRM